MWPQHTRQLIGIGLGISEWRERATDRVFNGRHVNPCGKTRPHPSVPLKDGLQRSPGSRETVARSAGRSSGLRVSRRSLSIAGRVNSRLPSPDKRRAARLRSHTVATGDRPMGLCSPFMCRRWSFSTSSGCSSSASHVGRPHHLSRRVERSTVGVMTPPRHPPESTEVPRAKMACGGSHAPRVP